MYKPYCTEEEVKVLVYQLNLNSQLFEYAMGIAKQVHNIQVRDDGKPYLEQHIFPIVKSVIEKNIKKDYLNEMLILSILHDVLEDDLKIDHEKFKTILGQKLYQELKLLSKKKVFNEKLTQDEKYLRNKEMIDKLRHAPIYVRIIKIEDRLNNLLCTEAINNIPKYIRFLKETEDFFYTLADSIDSEYKDLLQYQVNRLKNT